MTDLVPAEHIDQAILTIRGQRVMVDADLAALYGVETKRLNEQVKRNSGRFPADFMLQLTAEEKAEVVANCDHLQRLKFSPVLPHAFTEHGAVMLASVLKTPTAVDTSVLVVRAFVRLRQVAATQDEIIRRLDSLEAGYFYHDARIGEVFEAIRQLMTPADPGAKRIGFKTDET